MNEEKLMTLLDKIVGDLIAEANAHAVSHGLANLRFEVATAKDFPGEAA